MSRVLCLAEIHPTKRTRAKKAVPDKTDAQTLSLTILDRVRVGAAAHTPVWATLRKHGTRLAVIDAEHPEDALSAYVIMIDQLGGEAVHSLGQVLAALRTSALAAEKDTTGADILGKRLDRFFEQELEWLSIRNLLAAALPRAGGGRAGKRAKKSSRALLLIDV
ncbi:MAG: hypothetical protein WC829_22890 [Hyphomicrobium sp.]|jgi:hypothetical protein